MADPVLTAQFQKTAGERSGLMAQQYQALLHDPARAGDLNAQIERNEAELRRAQEQADQRGSDHENGIGHLDVLVVDVAGPHHAVHPETREAQSHQDQQDDAKKDGRKSKNGCSDHPGRVEVRRPGAAAPPRWSCSAAR